MSKFVNPNGSKKLTSIEKRRRRIALAEDGLAQIYKGGYRAIHTAYVRLDHKIGEVIPNAAALQKITNRRGMKCYVSTLGGLLISKARLYGNVSPAEFNEGAGFLRQRFVYHALQEYFSKNQLIILEYATNGHSSQIINSIDAACDWRDCLSANIARGWIPNIVFAHSMVNIIRNRGTFKPKDLPTTREMSLVRRKLKLPAPAKTAA